MVIFGDSNSDTGRAFNAPAAYPFEEHGIGPFPWKRLYAALDSNVRPYHFSTLLDVGFLAHAEE